MSKQPATSLDGHDTHIHHELDLIAVLDTDR
jgi:hypothetical protein